jgi:hypothetical protein
MTKISESGSISQSMDTQIRFRIHTKMLVSATLISDRANKNFLFVNLFTQPLAFFDTRLL